MLFIGKKNSYLKNNKIYGLVINDTKLDIYLKRITTYKDIYLNFIYSKTIFQNEGYFLYKQNAFSSFFFKDEVDLIFVNDDGFVIDFYISFLPNSVTDKNENTKFLYVLPKNTINNLTSKIDKNTRFSHVKSSKGRKVFKRKNIL